MDATFLTAQTVLTTSGRWRADDTIVRDVGWLFDHGQPALTVVTSDKLLRKRCRAASKRSLVDDFDHPARPTRTV